MLVSMTAETRPPYGASVARAIRPRGATSGSPSLVREADPPSDPFSEQDALVEIGDEIVRLAAHDHAIRHRMLQLIAEFDRRGGWKLGGHRDCAAWLEFRTGMSRRTAREHVRVARGMHRVPRAGEAMSRGEISFSKLRALSRLGEWLEDREPEARAEAEERLVELARASTAAELERVVRRWRDVTAEDEAERERRRHASRTLSVTPDDAGMYVVRGRLDPEVGALLMRAIEAAGDALFRTGEEWASEGGTRGPRTREVTPAQRRADALGLLAERALAAGFGATSEGPAAAPGSEDGGSAEPGEEGGEQADDSDAAARGGSAEPVPEPAVPLSGTRAGRYEVVIRVDAGVLAGAEESESGAECDACRGRDDVEPDAAGVDPGPHCHLADGTRLAVETVRRLACDGAVVGALRGPDGSVLDVGRRTRTIPAAIRRAVEIRDGGCRFPGCGLRFCEAHHVQHWTRGGETKLENLILLCRHHHRMVHEEGMTLTMDRKGRVRFYDRTGWPLPHRPPPMGVAGGAPGDPPGLSGAERAIAENRRCGIHPGPDAPSARYKRRRDIPQELEDRAWEALDPPEGEPLKDQPPERGSLDGDSPEADPPDGLPAE